MLSSAPPPPRLTRALYDDDGIHSLCDAVDQIRPRSHGEWMMVVHLHAQTYPDRNRHAESLNRQWAKTFRRCRAAVTVACPGGNALVVDRPSYLQRVLDIQRRLKATRTTTKNSHPLLPVSTISSNDVIVSNNHAVTATGIKIASNNDNHVAVDTSGIHNATASSVIGSNNYQAVVTGVNNIANVNVNDNATHYHPSPANTSGANVNGGNINHANDNLGIQEEHTRREERHRFNLLLQQVMDRHDEEMDRRDEEWETTVKKLLLILAGHQRIMMNLLVCIALASRR